jgi:hypothetical protein
MQPPYENNRLALQGEAVESFEGYFPFSRICFKYRLSCFISSRINCQFAFFFVITHVTHKEVSGTSKRPDWIKAPNFWLDLGLLGHSPFVLIPRTCSGGSSLTCMVYHLDRIFTRQVKYSKIQTYV